MATKKRTVNGKPVPTAVEHLLPSSLTDERFEDAKIYGSGASVTRDGGFDTELDQFETQLWMSRDPMTEALEKAKADRPDRAFRFLSDRVVNRNGMRGFQVVTKENGDPVTVAGLKLGFMPERYAELRKAHYEREYREAVENAVQNYNESQDRMIRDSGAVGSFQTLKPGSVVDDSSDPGSSASIGLTRMRGGREV